MRWARSCARASATTTRSLLHAGDQSHPEAGEAALVLLVFARHQLRAGQKWQLAEVDLQRALVLYPDQPMVLNYLGYSWIDQNKNLKQGMTLIEKAVALKPDDGYIVDSLGWAHYKLGNYKEAVRYLERAVELRPEDPVLRPPRRCAVAGRPRARGALQWSSR
jgi:tetratricopeptide (TPR) repeat protein